MGYDNKIFFFLTLPCYYYRCVPTNIDEKKKGELHFKGGSTFKFINRARANTYQSFKNFNTKIFIF